MAKSRTVKVKDKSIKKVRSKLEQTVANTLYKFKANYTYENIKITFSAPYTTCVDFYVQKKDETYMCIEAKGYFRKGETKKYKYLRLAEPDLDFRFIFEDADKPVRKGAKLNHGQWAEKHGYKWADKEFPKEWLKELL